MNPHLCRVALRPRGPLEVFDLATRLVRARLGPLVRLGVVLGGPLAVVAFALGWWFEGHPALLLLPLVAAPLLQAPFTILTGRLMFADEVGLGAVLRDVVGRLPSLAATWLLGLMGWAVGLLSCGSLLLVTQPALVYLPETALLERIGPTAGLRRTLRLAGGHAGIALTGALSRWLLLAWFALVGEMAGQAVVNTILQLGQPFGSLVDQQVTPYLLVGMLAAQPAIAIYRLLLYVDVRTRVEGWDLQVGLRAAGLGRERGAA